MVAVVVVVGVGGVFAAGSSSGGGFAPVLTALWAMVVVVPPVVLSLVAFLGVRAVTRSRWSAVVADGLGWLVGGAVNGVLFYLSFHEDPELYGVGVSFVLFAVPYLVGLVTYLSAGPGRFGDVVYGFALVAAVVFVATAVVLAIVRG